MDTYLLDYTLKELFMLRRSNKIEAITMLIDSIADDKAFETKAWIETEIEAKERKVVKAKGKVVKISRASGKIEDF